MSLYKLEQEKQFLSAAIRHPAILAECPLTERDFSPVNRVVFSALRACVASGVEFSHHLLIDRLASYGIKVAETIDPAIYVNALVGLGVVEKAGIGIAKELKRTSVRRELHEIGRKIQAATAQDVAPGDNEPKKATELLAEVTGIFNEHVNIISGSKDDEPANLYGSIRSFLDIDNSFSSRAIASPWVVLNDLYGYFDAGSVWLIASRMKIGKSSLWLSLGQQLCAQDKDDELRILVLDTELTLQENQSRALAAASGVSEFRIRQGWYKKRKDERERVEAAADLLEPFNQRVQHIYVGGKDLNAIISLTRRWAFKNLTEGKRGLLVYDYIKLNSREDFRSKNPLFLQIGEKIDSIKNLSKELNIPAICFCQTNRENVETKGGEKQQNSSVIGGSDMLAQFSSVVLLLEELTPDERAAMNQLGKDDATHSLREIACRQRGPCELGEDRLVPIKAEKGSKIRYVKNYLLFNFSQFNVREVSTLKRVVERNTAMGINVQPVESKPDLL
ncbi:MAG: DnaB-like helicase C-terminal domain-containing protein [Candidatus Paceibacterota bacterium]